ncbi:PAS domain S-box protein [Pararhodobacter oceanensis]|uniref:sensor histidine kinase n=1 Tax=Pararhodobacter oceanensis TaxID=2172121 RepID=UPI003A8CD6D5
MTDTPILDAFEHMRLPLLIVGPRGTIRRANEAANELFACHDAGLPGRKITELLPVASIDELHAYIEPPACEAVIKQMVAQTCSGATVPLVVHMTAWTDPSGDLNHTLALRDISDEVQADLVSQAELLRANSAITGARIGVFEYNAVDDTVIVSDVWRELLGLERDDTQDLQLRWRARVHPDDLAAALRPVDLCLSGAVARASSEHRYHSGDGGQWRWFRSDISVAKRDAKGAVTRVVGALTDITERKAIENDLRKSEERFKSAFDSATTGKAIVGLDGRWLRINPAISAMLGYTEEEILSTNFQALTHPDDLDVDLDNLKRLTAGEIENYQIEKRYLRRDGEVVWGLLSVVAIKDSEGRPEQYLSQIVDITEQRRLTELKSEFVATVSHELRTPLTSVLGALSLLSFMDSEPLSDEAQRLLYIAQENGKRLHTLVNDILDFEKFSVGRVHFAFSQHKVQRLVEEAIMTNMNSADKYNVRFNTIGEDREAFCYVDARRFQQVMTNLLENAAKFAAEGSEVDVRIEPQPSEIRISVTNAGDAIPSEFRDKIFKPFSQAESSTTRERGGTGLGLNITKQIVEKSGGRIGFDSGKDGKTTFWFTVPRKEPSAMLQD